MPLLQQRLWVVAQVQGHVGPDHLHLTSLRWYGLDFVGLEPPLPPGPLQHGEGFAFALW